MAGALWSVGEVFPTGYFGARLAEIRRGDTVAVFGCGPVGQFALKIGNCNHRAYLPELVRAGAIDPSQVLTQSAPLMDAIEAYKSFDLREPGWIKVKLEPGG